jgi:hypothetical protein
MNRQSVLCKHFKDYYEFKDEGKDLFYERIKDKLTKCDICKVANVQKKCHISFKNNKCYEICINCTEKHVIPKDTGCTINGEHFNIDGKMLEQKNVIFYTSHYSYH